MHRVHSSRVLALAVVAILGVLVAACGNSGDDDTAATTTAVDASDAEPDAEPTDGDRDTFVSLDGVPGVTDDEIAYSVISIKANNPLGTCILDCYVDGIEAYFAFRNSEGGIFGRDLVLGDVLDDELGAHQVRALEVVEGGDSFGTFSATLVATGLADLNEAGIPTYQWANNALAGGLQAVYSSIASICTGCTARGVPYTAKTAGATKAASLSYGISDASRLCGEANDASLKKYEADTGVELVYSNNGLDFGLPNGIAPEVTAMKEAGVEFIATCIDINGMKSLAQELSKQGMDDVVLYHPNTYNQDFVAESDPLFEGDYVAVQFRPFESDAGDSALADYFEWMEDTGSELTELAMVGWINASLAFEGLLAAGPEFDRAAVVAATNALTDFTADGLVVPIDWSRQHGVATEGDPAADYEMECQSVVKVVDGAFETVAPPEKPWVCWSNENLDWSEPSPTDF